MACRVGQPTHNAHSCAHRIDNTSAVAWQNSTLDQHQWTTTDLARYLREHSVADSTYAKYDRSFRVWAGFITRRGLNPWLNGVSIEAQIQHISDFILAGFQEGFGSGHPVRSSTITTTLMGIRHFILAAGHAFPSDHPQVRMLLKGISRLDSPPERNSPVSIQLLETSFASLNMSSSADQALWGVLCLAFFFLLCRSEIASISKGRFRWFALKAQDVVVLDHTGTATLDANTASSVTIKLRGSKTNQSGKATIRMLRRSGHRFICPVLGALLVLRARRTLPGNLPVATYPSSSGTISSVSAHQVANTIREGARRSGCDPRAYSTHSLRSGGATHMYRAGVDALTIQFHGRWASDTFKIYTRLSQESVSNLAANMVSGEKSATTLQ
ncbi:hypothetical protein PR003_g25249 [Phytophthora rubi]|uniref:Tyr recombinase domain-containing protein n=1 Tax=Phytophthora rubi TaxID=129364 RepID=A0A6A4CJY7_9STRA|nr:hypothetical protein PR003_g25249 [Phytophthora rubi]